MPKEIERILNGEVPDTVVIEVNVDNVISELWEELIILAFIFPAIQNCIFNIIDTRYSIESFCFTREIFENYTNKDKKNYCKILKKLYAKIKCNTKWY
jgi:hypothetical protein